MRCMNPNAANYKRYGGRGIAVCKRWLGEHGFENFLADMGPRPKGTTLDRYPNNDGDYKPSNCRWRTLKQQGQRTRKVKLTEEKAHQIRELAIAGLTQVEVALKFGVSSAAVRDVIAGRTWAQESIA